MHCAASWRASGSCRGAPCFPALPAQEIPFPFSFAQKSQPGLPTITPVHASPGSPQTRHSGQAHGLNSKLLTRTFGHQWTLHTCPPASRASCPWTLCVLVPGPHRPVPPSLPQRALAGAVPTACKAPPLPLATSSSISSLTIIPICTGPSGALMLFPLTGEVYSCPLDHSAALGTEFYWAEGQ